jgi:hypothetical protein
LHFGLVPILAVLSQFHALVYVVQQKLSVSKCLYITIYFADLGPAYDNG